MPHKAGIAQLVEHDLAKVGVAVRISFPAPNFKKSKSKDLGFLLLKLLILSILKLIKQKNLQKENNHIKGVEHFDCKLLNRIARKCNGMYSKAFIFYQRIQS